MGERTFRVGKLDAARRQLQTAITLWFTEGDPVSIHTLAFAAYEIVHTISKKRDPKRLDLIFDSKIIKDEHRSEFNIWIKAQAGFFKHGDRDGDAVIDFAPALSEMFLFFAIIGLEACGERKSLEERAYVWWLYLQKPHLLTNSGETVLKERLPVEAIEHLRTVPKRQFFDAFKEATRLNRI